MLSMGALAQAPASYDSTLAKQLGADDYGMKAYVLCLLKTGSATIKDKEQVSKHFAGHMANIEHLVQQGQLIVAGPLGKNEKSYRGIFIFNVSKIETAKALVMSDPAVKAGLLDYELYQWYGSAALPVYLETADKISKVKPW